MDELLFGVDFGTTFSTVAVHDGASARVIGSGAQALVPSAVYYPTDGAPVVGEAALSRAIFEPERTVTCVKRLLGRGFDTKVVKDFISSAVFEVQADEERFCRVCVGDLRLSPSDIATAVFDELRRRACAETGTSYVTAVVTAPAHFGAAQKRAIHSAATRAGIDVVRVLTEPTAASVAYRACVNDNERVMIFDMGGGTLDVTVLLVSQDAHEILAVGGHPMLGGIDIDQIVCQELEHQVLRQCGQNVRDSPVGLRRLLVEAEQIKIALSEIGDVDIVVPQLFPGTDARLRYNRRALEAATAGLIDRAIEISETVLRDAGLHREEIDKILLVGGSTRMPSVQQRLQDAYGIRPSRTLHPQEAVALGAATFAHTLGTAEAMRVLDVLPASVGIADANHRLVTVLRRNTILPCEASFEVAFDQSESPRLSIFQGDQQFVDDNEVIGELQFEGLDPSIGLALVTLRADMAGMVTASAFDPASGRVLQTTFNINVRQRISSWAR